jgi:hypothetical protein
LPHTKVILPARDGGTTLGPRRRWTSWFRFSEVL